MAGLYRIGQYQCLFHTANLLNSSDVCNFFPCFSKPFLHLFVSLPSGCLGGYPFDEEHEFGPFHTTETDALSQKDTGMEPSLFKAFVIDHVAAILPMQYLHHLTGFTDEYVHVAV